MALLFMLGALIAFDIAALLWGADSREHVDSPEWLRLARWRGFH